MRGKQSKYIIYVYKSALIQIRHCAYEYTIFVVDVVYLFVFVVVLGVFLVLYSPLKNCDFFPVTPLYTQRDKESTEDSSNEVWC